MSVTHTSSTQAPSRGAGQHKELKLPTSVRSLGRDKQVDAVVVGTENKRQDASSVRAKR